ncbi:hypothetical protein GGX14DRAFT_601928 [Mycena pura]|uniref:Uncharacterized protein n=1 Tax=Mycena pura TaxID=153505 RepID=A0AAD6VN29_9AGAR|nr:hypothetical protein GGX14DRAFT_601928 [Mycena pura]
MGKARTALKDFDDLPDDKLEALPTLPGTIYKDTNFRLDMQGMTTPVTEKRNKQVVVIEPAKHNLQIQVNKNTTVSTLKKAVPNTVAGPILVPSDAPCTSTTDLPVPRGKSDEQEDGRGVEVAILTPYALYVLQPLPLARRRLRSPSPPPSASAAALEADKDDAGNGQRRCASGKGAGRSRERRGSARTDTSTQHAFHAHAALELRGQHLPLCRVRRAAPVLEVHIRLARLRVLVDFPSLASSANTSPLRSAATPRAVGHDAGREDALLG